MPPKKQQQQNSSPYLPVYVLPLFMSKSSGQSSAQRILRGKPINIKKVLQKTKIIQILKQKGLSQHLSPEGALSEQARKFICENVKTLLQDFNAEITKPVDAKKDVAKKDTKKDAKKQDVSNQQVKQPTIELNFDKKCNDFHFCIDFITNSQQLQLSIHNGLKIDIVVVIEDRVKKGSKVPDYSLLSKSFQPSQLMQRMNSTKIGQHLKGQSESQTLNKVKNNKSILQTLRRIKNQNPQFANALILQFPFQKDLSHPENDELNFINTFFQKLCEITVQKQVYLKWVKTQAKTSPMIEPLRQIIKKQVAIQTQDKKGKKDGNKQPQFEIVEQVIETKYESIAQNIRSNLQSYRKIQKLRRSPKGFDQIGALLQSCIQSVQIQLKTTSPNTQNQTTQNSDKNQAIRLPQSDLQNKINKLNKRPTVKLNTLQYLRQNLRKVQLLSKNGMANNLVHKSKEIQTKVSFQQILHKEPNNKDVLQYEHIIKSMTQFMKSQQPRLKWDFSDRNYREKLNKQQILSEIQHQMLKNPQIYQGIINKDNIKLLCLAKVNPPGRVLYSNNIFQAKTLPDFENWLGNSAFKAQKRGSFEFYDYKFQQAGNLSIKAQILTPTDNVIIVDQKVTCGSISYKVNHFEKQNTTYGIKQLESEYNEFWLSDQKQKTKLSIFQKQHELKKTSLVTQTTKVQGSDETSTVQNIIQSVQKLKRVQVWFRTQNFILANDPYPKIIWLGDKKNRSAQIRRQFGAKGQITCYLNDGTVRIFYLNGNVSTFRNNQLEKIVDNQRILPQGRTKLQITEYIQGDKTIKIRDDQTSFIEYSSGNTLVVFHDETKVLYKKADKSYVIWTYNPTLKQEIIVRITQPRNKDFNVIGHGSAFAYLGFKNILQRSFDGFLYEVWNNKISTHLYNQKYEYENKFYEEEIRLIYLENGSLVRVEGTGQIVYIQGDYSKSEEKLKQKWNQAFTSVDHHEVGVYDINLNQGWIKTKDAESNSFKIHLEQQNEIHIAVSFKISEEDKIKNYFGDGFHVPQQNFFLPAPQNSLPPRIFSFDQQSQLYYEYLNQDQIRQMEIQSSGYHVEQAFLQRKVIKQYSKRMKACQEFLAQKKQEITFSHAPQSKDFQVPSLLISKQTKVNMKIENDPIGFRVLQKIQWDRSFSNINKIEEVLLKRVEQRQKQLKVLNN